MRKVFIVIIAGLFLLSACKKDDNPVSTEAEATVEYSGTTYHTLKIGTQYWLKENINIGTMIQGNTEQTNNGVIEKYCYNNDPANCAKYGGLYQWNEAMQYAAGAKAKGICPPGWHIPSYDEYQTLAKSVNGEGNSLKAVGEGTGAGTGTNSSGFGLLLAGSRESGGVFADLHYYPFLWSNSTNNSTEAAYFYVPYMYNLTGGWNTYPKDYGLSVRCVKD